MVNVIELFVTTEIPVSMYCQYVVTIVIDDSVGKLTDRNWWYNVNKTKHNEGVWIFYGIYCVSWDYPRRVSRIIKQLNEHVSHSLQWCHNERNGVSNRQPHDCLLNRLFRRRSKKTPKLCVTGLCEGNSPVTGEFPTQRASKAENVSLWWRHHMVIVSWLVPT